MFRFTRPFAVYKKKEGKKEGEKKKEGGKKGEKKGATEEEPPLQPPLLYLLPFKDTSISLDPLPPFSNSPSVFLTRVRIVMISVTRRSLAKL